MAQKSQPELTRPQHDLDEHDHASLLQERRESDDIGFGVITSRFTVLMFAVELAQQIHAHYMETQEAGSRQPWDIILHLACCRHDQVRGYGIISGDVMYVPCYSRQSHAYCMFSGPKSLSTYPSPYCQLMHKYVLFCKTRVI